MSSIPEGTPNDAGRNRSHGTWPTQLAVAYGLAAAVVIGAGSLLGWLVGLYDALWWYDEAQHALAAATLAPLAIYVLPGPVRAALAGSTGRLVLLATLLWMGAAAIWEVFEWGLDAVSSTNLSKGYSDTLVDLALGLSAGWVSTALLAQLRHTR